MHHAKLYYLTALLVPSILVGCGSGDGLAEESPAIEGTGSSAMSAALNPNAHGELSTGDLIYDPFNIFGGGPIGELTPGKIYCPGHEPTGDPLAPCPPGSKMDSRGVSVVMRATGTDDNPLANGWIYTEANTNKEADGSGREWGKWRLELDAGGTWEGTYEGTRSVVPEGCSGRPCWKTVEDVVGRGTSGIVAGMHLQHVQELTSFTLVPIAAFGTWEGRAW